MNEWQVNVTAKEMRSTHLGAVGAAMQLQLLERLPKLDVVGLLVRDQQLVPGALVGGLYLPLGVRLDIVLVVLDIVGLLVHDQQLVPDALVGGLYLQRHGLGPLIGIVLALG